MSAVGCGKLIYGVARPRALSVLGDSPSPNIYKADSNIILRVCIINDIFTVSIDYKEQLYSL